jgi:adenylate kinase
MPNKAIQPIATLRLISALGGGEPPHNIVSRGGSNMQTWIVTGVSGSNRIELLNELAEYCNTQGRTVLVHDVGTMMATEARRQKLQFSDDKILDVDAGLLRTLRAAVIKGVRVSVCEHPTADLHLIGIHASFRWKERLIPGISFTDIGDLRPDGFINVVDDVNTVHKRNAKNLKWDATSLPNLERTQDWMIEEEFITEVLAEVQSKPMYLVARRHKVSNLADLFFSTKKRIYLSYPITAVRKEQPDLLARIQSEILTELERLFVVFNPLTIEDMSLINSKDLPATVDKFTPDAQALIKSRTVERDYQFIDQSNAVVVYYMTDKVSPGVLAEIYYAHRNMKKVYLCFPYALSPFLEGAATQISKTPEAQLELLQKFADSTSSSAGTA